MAGGALALVAGLPLGLSRVVGGAVGNDPLSLVLVLLVLVALALDGESLALSLRLPGAATLLVAALGYAFVLHRTGIRI